MTETLVFEMRTEVRCERCEWLSPLAGLRLHVACHNCGAKLDVKQRHIDGTDFGLGYLFGGYYDVVAEALVGEPELHDKSDSHGTPTVVATATAARCGCGGELALPEPDATAVGCGACGDRVPVRWADEGTRAWDPRIWCVIGDAGETATATAAAAKPPTLSGKVVSCGGCGAALAPKDKARTVACTHCENTNVLGDDTWAALHPDAEDHRFYLAYRVDDALYPSFVTFLENGDDVFADERGPDDERPRRHGNQETNGLGYELGVKIRAMLEQRQIASATAAGAIDLEIARRFVARALGAGELVAIDALLTDEQVTQLALGKVKREWTARWSASDREARRLAVATREDTAVTVADASPRVRAALANRAVGPALATLATDADASVRAIVAARASVPPALLKTLANDADPDVKAAARANPGYKAPGFFGRLFGG